MPDTGGVLAAKRYLSCRTCLGLGVMTNDLVMGTEFECRSCGGAGSLAHLVQVSLISAQALRSLLDREGEA